MDTAEPAGTTAGDGNPPAPDEHDRSMVYAAKAMERIKALRLPATPRNYEIWYAYATGHYPSLNHIIDDLLARRGEIAGATLEQIGARFVSPGGIRERIDALGARVADEIDQIIASIEASVGSASDQSEVLASLGESLPRVRDGDSLRLVVEKMVMTAIESRNDRRRLEAKLNSSRTEICELQEKLQAAREASQTDPVTGLANRAAFERTLRQAVAWAAERGQPLALILGDIDDFKSFNDAWGPLTGDQVLRLVAAEMKKQSQPHDVVARYGGEEFAILLPDTALQAAYELADGLRRAVMSRDILNRTTGQNLGRVTMSFGIAAARKGDGADTLLRRADSCLYAAKCTGRNRVTCETDPEFAGAGPNAAAA
jgi:diguanylate cyclase